MEVIEIKFLLKLLSWDKHRTSISKIRLGTSIKASVRNQVFRRLFERLLIQFTEKIAKIRITASGKTALNKNAEQLTQLQLKVLLACQKKGIPPSGTGVSAAQGRQTLISELAHLGLITTSTKIDEVWLTAPGKEYLAILYKPTGGGNINLSKKMLADYLEFLRGYFSTTQSEEQVTPPAAELADDNNIDDNVILRAIVDLDKQYKSDNNKQSFVFVIDSHPYLEINLTKQAIRLQKSDKIDFSTLAEIEAYTSEELEAGIPQLVGGSLFYILRTVV